MPGLPSKMLKAAASLVLARHSRLIISVVFTGVPCFVRHGVNRAPVRKRRRDSDTAGSSTRRRAQTWRSFFIAPCASLFVASRTSLRPCPWRSACWLALISWRSGRDGVKRARSAAVLSILLAVQAGFSRHWLTLSAICVSCS